MRKLLVVVYISLLISGCSQSLPRFPAFGVDGKPIAVSRSLEGSSSDGGSVTIRPASMGRVDFDVPVGMEGKGALLVSLTGGVSGIRLGVLTAGPEKAELVVETEGRPEHVEAALDLAAGSVVRGLAVHTTNDEVTLAGLRFVPPQATYGVVSGITKRSNRIDRVPLNRGSIAFDVSIRGDRLRLDYDGSKLGENAQIRLVSATGEARRFSLSRQRGLQSVYLYQGALGLRPARIELTELADAFRALALEEIEAEDPLPVDLGMLLLQPRSAWRRDDFELYRWNLFPSVLIMDTKDLAFQERMFSRLAFYIEKKGFAGRLLTNAELEGRHGWNAHNYDADGLARFFERARRENFPLNEEEVMLRQILIRQGVITAGPAGFGPGNGAVLAISQGSGPLTRRLLLNHEAWHGVYYESQSLRRLALRLWEELEADPRRFWLFFFSWMAYDTTNSSLVVNEYQAYLLQQKPEAADQYFKRRIAGRIVHQFPDKQAEYDELFKTHPRMFVDPARRLRELAVEIFGPGGLDSLVPLD